LQGDQGQRLIETTTQVPSADAAREHIHDHRHAEGAQTRGGAGCK
jgi:hypothetical protein